MDRLKRFSLKLNSLQRVLLYVAASTWFLAFTASQQRNYQDAWILDGVIWPFLALVVLLMYLLGQERDTRAVAAYASITLVVVALTPGLKYVQPYGTTIDATDHYLMVNTLMQTGGIDPDHTYASIPALHSWLATMGLMGGLSPEWVLKIGLPMLGAVMPLLVYWMTRRAAIPEDMAKYMIAATVLSSFPYFMPNGTGFSLVPLMLVVGVLMVRELHTTSRRGLIAYTILLLIGMFQLIFWHSTTPMLLPIVVGMAAFSPLILWVLGMRDIDLRVAKSVLRISMLAGILFLSYRLLETDRVFQVVLKTAMDLVSNDGETASAVPQRIFEITPSDAILTTLLLHGRALLIYALSGLSFIALWRRRRDFRQYLPFFSYLVLVYAAFVALVVIAAGSGIGYTRFMSASFALSPFFVGLGLWWVEENVFPNLFGRRWIVRIASFGLVGMIIGIWGAEFFNAQPLVPTASSIEPGLNEEYIVWIHAANSAYQERMLHFAETNASPETRFAIDVDGQRQFRRYFGIEASALRGMYLPLHWQQPVDTKKVKIFLLHWPGKAGGLGEKVEYRSVSRLSSLRDTPRWGLIYDNGESFILWIR